MYSMAANFSMNVNFLNVKMSNNYPYLFILTTSGRLIQLDLAVKQIIFYENIFSNYIKIWEMSYNHQIFGFITGYFYTTLTYDNHYLCDANNHILLDSSLVNYNCTSCTYSQYVLSNGQCVNIISLSSASIPIQ